MKLIIEQAIQKMIRRPQKFVTPAFVLFISICAVAQAHPGMLPDPDRKKINVGGEFQQIEIWGDVTMILRSAPATEILLEGDPKDIGCVKTIVKKGELVINAEKKKSFSRLVVYVPAKNITSMFINGNSEIFSSGIITSKELEIILNGVSLIDVFHEGNVRVIAGAGYELVGNKEKTGRKMLNYSNGVRSVMTAIKSNDKNFSPPMNVFPAFTETAWNFMRF